VRVRPPRSSEQGGFGNKDRAKSRETVAARGEASTAIHLALDQNCTSPVQIWVVINSYSMGSEDEIIDTT
jgi:hypothetical protein